MQLTGDPRCIWWPDAGPGPVLCAGGPHDTAVWRLSPLCYLGQAVMTSWDWVTCEALNNTFVLCNKICVFVVTYTAFDVSQTCTWNCGICKFFIFVCYCIILAVVLPGSSCMEICCRIFQHMKKNESAYFH